MTTAKELIELAKEVLDNAYCPYSQFPVSCALEMTDGRVIRGVNVENVSFGATNCAERSAIFTAISQGYKKGNIRAIAIVGKTTNYLAPCQICRQVMVEFCDPTTPIYLTKADGEVLTTTLGELSPMAFKELDRIEE
ncbi:cytidine deaminase [Atopobacter sp. AH10]|uniref:cytidine deaminase n=1 Tax=Atopobacter sp. AH10 TaxID=2315861 RepID=UPI000EF283AD|nr:cytidine deaminase [Atopobacter sp. AH10]RLK64163.1 cytidine deaminase [Atopobacter sp. AH10]